MCVAALLATFGAAVGLTGLGRYLSAANAADQLEIKKAFSEIQNSAPSTEEIEKTIAAAKQKNDQEAEKTEESTDDKYDYAGEYCLYDDPVKGFDDFEKLDITTLDYSKATPENSYQTRPIPPEGFIYTTGGKLFRYTRISLGKKQISFVTEAKNGISYRFEGEFPSGESIGVKSTNDFVYQERVDLKGRLTKLRDGKKIAEAEVKLYVGGC